jgi:hypothetical protein
LQCFIDRWAQHLFVGQHLLPGVTLCFRRPPSPAPLPGVTVDALLFGALWLAWMLSQQYNRVLRQLSRRERLKVTWGAAPQVTVVQAAPGCSTPHSRTDSDPQDGSGSSEAALAVGLLRQGRARMRGASSKVVWASFQGPDAAADGGYEPLPDEQQQEEEQRGAALHAEGSSRESVELSPPRRQLHAAVGSPAAAALVSPQALHGRQVSIDCNEDDMTPHRLHSRLVAQHRQSLLSSPLSSMHAGAGAPIAMAPVPAVAVCRLAKALGLCKRLPCIGPHTGWQRHQASFIRPPPPGLQGRASGSCASSFRSWACGSSRAASPCWRG